MFKLAHRIILRDLRNLLVSHGIPIDTPRRGLSCADALQACLEKKLPEELTLLPKLKLTNQALPNSANQAFPQLQQYSQPQPQYRVSSQPQYSIQPPFVQPQVQPQVSQRSVQYDDDDNWSWPSNKQEQQETSESYEQPDFSYEVNDDNDDDDDDDDSDDDSDDDGQSEGEDWDDDDYNNDYSDNDYE